MADLKPTEQIIKTTSKEEVLLNRTPLFPYETLSSFFARLNELNSYGSSNILPNLFFKEPNQQEIVYENLDLPFRLTTYQNIASLTSVDIYKIYMSTLHRFAPTLVSPPEQIKSFQLSDDITVPGFPKGYYIKYLRPSHSAQFCPQCLRNQSYHSLVWMPLAISVCLEHECLLVDRCPQCKQVLSKFAVIKAQCDKCQTDLTKAIPISAKEDEFGLQAQQILHSWFTDQATPIQLESLLPKQPIRVLYRIIEGLRSCIQSLNDWNWSYLHRPKFENVNVIPWYQEKREILTSYESYCLYTTALNILISWPYHFYSFLFNYRNKCVTDPTYTGTRFFSEPLKTIVPGERAWGYIRDNLGDFYRLWIMENWAYPEFKFLKDAFFRYIAENYWLNQSGEQAGFCRTHPDLAQFVKRVDLSNAALLLGISPATLKMLLQPASIIPTGTINKDDIEHLRKNDVLSYYLSWDQPNAALATVKELAAHFDLEGRVIEDLFVSGILTYPLNKLSKIGKKSFTMRGIATFLEKLLEHITSLPAQDNNNECIWVSLPDVMHIFSQRNLRGATLFLLIISGRLTAYRQLGQEIQLKSLLFRYQDIQDFISFIEKASHLIADREVADLLGISIKDLSQWVYHDILYPLALGDLNLERVFYFSPDIIENFQSKYICQTEIAELLGIDIDSRDEQRISKRFALKVLQVPGNFRIFDKEKLVNWRKERLNFNETMQELNMCSATLKNWIRERKIITLDEKYGGQKWFLRQHVLELKNKM